MPKHRILNLTEKERQELVWLRDHAQIPYLRERAAALIKIADGEKAAIVARKGLLRPHDPHTINAWMDRYLQDGVDGLLVREGRGRKVSGPFTEEEIFQILNRQPIAQGDD